MKQKQLDRIDKWFREWEGTSLTLAQKRDMAFDLRTSKYWDGRKYSFDGIEINLEELGISIHKFNVVANHWQQHLIVPH
jgi:hypothetical protein